MSVARRAHLVVALCAAVSSCKPSSGGDGHGATPAPQPSSSDAGLISVHGRDASIFDPGEGGIPTRATSQASKIDVLVMVDDSISMGDKHQILKAAVPDLLGRFVNPVCVAPNGSTSQPASALDACAPGTKRQFRPVDDIHVGVITSSLGGLAGVTKPAAICAGDELEPTNDGAHLVPSLPRATEGSDAGPAIPSYDGLGFFDWDPSQKSAPPGDANLDHVIQSFTDTIDRVGEAGCGYEASLESWYRFLVDPEPPEKVVAAPCPEFGGVCSVPQGTDATVLAQRRAFLRPDSLVLIVMLTDEDDCSMTEDRYGFFRSDLARPRGSTVCLTKPDDACCYPCTGSPPAGCAADAACAAPLHLDQAEDPPNTTCIGAKSKYGFDPLYPTSRYVAALTQPQITNRAGIAVENPLFAGAQRTKDEVFLVGIVGVPWQDVATDETLHSASQLRLKSASDLAKGGWDVILGGAGTPLDPLMLQAVLPRSGQNPVTKDELAPPAAAFMQNPINGHERLIPYPDDTQYSCIFPLLASKDCGGVRRGPCDCSQTPDAYKNPICQAPTGEYEYVQRFAKAFPPPRILTVLKAIGNQAVVSSICPKNVDDPSREDYGYRPIVGATIQDVAPTIIR
jgi:hypothetical protein